MTETDKPEKRTATLNEKEAAVWDVIKRHQKGTTIEIIAEKAEFKGLSKFNKDTQETLANSWTRNSLRRPLRYGLIKRVTDGTYEPTGKKLEDVKLPPRGSVTAAKKAAAAKKPKAEKAEKDKATKKTNGANSAPKVKAKVSSRVEQGPARRKKPASAKKAETVERSAESNDEPQASSAA